jgi:cytoskeletal protein RodZ
LKERDLDETILFANDYRHHLRRQEKAAAAAKAKAEAISDSDSDDDDESTSATEGDHAESSSTSSSDSESSSEADEAEATTQGNAQAMAQSEEQLADANVDFSYDFAVEEDEATISATTVYNSARWWRQQLGRAYHSWVKLVSTNTNIICYFALVINHAGTDACFRVTVCLWSDVELNLSVPCVRGLHCCALQRTRRCCR